MNDEWMVRIQAAFADVVAFMETLDLNSPSTHLVACMVCQWVWHSGVFPPLAPKCRHCKAGVGVDIFTAFYPEGRRGHYWWTVRPR